MPHDDLQELAESSGFSAAAVSELEMKLELFAAQVAQERTTKLLAVFSDYIRYELKACAKLCEHIPEAAELLAARADAFTLDVDEMMSCHLRAHLDRNP